MDWLAKPKTIGILASLLLISFVIGLVLFIGPWPLGRPSSPQPQATAIPSPPSSGASPTTVAQEPTRVPVPTTTVAESPQPSPTVVATEPEVPSAPAPSPQAGQGGPAERKGAMSIRVPAARVDSEVVAIGLTEQGYIEAPPTPDIVGWWKGSPPPGGQGNSVLTGHVDWGGRLAVFGWLRLMKPGDEIFVTSTDGREYTFITESNESYPQEEAPVMEILGPTTEPVLTLITCDGTFDRATRDYSNRLVVRARLA